MTDLAVFRDNPAPMALYDPLPEAELGAIAARFGLHLESAEGVPQGSINTNYRLTCTSGRFFLRYTRARGPADLDFEAGLLAHLKSGGFPCPAPLGAEGGTPYLGHRGGLVSVFAHLVGEELGPDRVTADHARAIGRILGRMHRLGGSFGGRRDNPYGPATVRAWLDDWRGKSLEPAVEDAVARATRALPDAADATGLPRGPIHADLFRDNVKWLGDRVSGVFDFEMACVDDYALDVGIALLVWTFGPASFERPRVRAFLEGYRAERPLRPEEAGALHRRATYGAIRFTLSRIRDFHLSPAGAQILHKKPWQRYGQRLAELLRLEEGGFLDLCGL